MLYSSTVYVYKESKIAFIRDKIATQIQEDINLDEFYMPKGTQNTVSFLASYAKSARYRYMQGVKSPC